MTSKLGVVYSTTSRNDEKTALENNVLVKMNAKMYPETENEALARLQGKWCLEGSDVLFEIRGYEIINLSGLQNSSGVEINQASFSLDFEEGFRQWRLSCWYVFGYKSNIAAWEEDYFIVNEYVVQIVGTESSGMPMLKKKFVRVH